MPLRGDEGIKLQIIPSPLPLCQKRERDFYSMENVECIPATQKAANKTNFKKLFIKST